VPRGARWALGVSASLIAMAAICGARADVRSIDLDKCSTACLPPATAEDEWTGDITLSLSGGGGTAGANNARPDLILDPKALPPVLVSGLPSPIAAVAADTLDSQGVSPYAFFAGVIDVPHSADAVPFFLSTPSLTSRLSDFLWASNDFFGPSSGDIASRRSLPLSADADALYGGLYGRPRVQTRVPPTLSPSPLSEPPSSDAPPSPGAAEPFGQVGNEAGLSAGFSSDGVESNK
jgi:hypothetical protein